MGLLDTLNGKRIKDKMELEIILSKLELLASCMKNNTDKPSDLKHWQELMTALYDINIKNVDFLPFVKESYDILYKLYLQRHFPELQK